MTASATLIWMAGILFGLSHSLLAGQAARAFAGRFGIRPMHYRLAYSLLATLLTGMWLWLAHTLPDSPLYAYTGMAALPFYGLQCVGLGVTLLSFRAFDAAMFLGLKPMPASGEPFMEQGLYRHMRHPMYTGVMLLLLASPVHTLNSLHLALAISAYFLIGSRFEEQRMLAMHADYADYRRRVPAFIPRAGLFRPSGTAQ